MRRHEDRYSRQILFTEIGRQGRERLKENKVLIVGCGALGCVIANILTRAGVGEINRDISDTCPVGGRLRVLQKT